MSQERLIAENFPAHNIKQKTFVNADVADGASTLSVLGTQGLATGDIIYIGELGDTRERKEILSVTPTTITLDSSLVYAHSKFETVISVYYDQFNFYRAVAPGDGTEPSDGSYIIIAGTQPVDIEPDQATTSFSDSDGGSGYWYKFTRFNSVTSDATTLANSPAKRGASYGEYVSVDSVRKMAGLKDNEYVTDQEIEEAITDAVSMVNGSLLIGGNTLPLTSIPNLVKLATKFLAAGYLLVVAYGPEVEGTNKDGNAKIKLGMDILKKIEGGTNIFIEVSESTTDNEVSGYPDDSAASMNPPEEPYFTINKKF